MRCPNCDNESTSVLDTRVSKKDGTRLRRRQCAVCNETFFTQEVVRAALPRIIKRDARREPFDLGKLRKGVESALHKRPISVDMIDELMNQVTQSFRSKGQDEVKSSEIGDAVMYLLGSLDHVAYIRYASVYQNFVNADQFGEVAKAVRNNPISMNRNQLSLPFKLTASQTKDE